MEQLADIDTEMKATLPRHGTVITSVPKSGTYLLRSLLLAMPSITPGPNLMEGIPPHMPAEERPAVHARLLLTARSTDVSITHFQYSEKCIETLAPLPHRRIFLIRDPRDFIVSYIDYVTDPESRHFHYELLAPLADDHARIAAMITGLPGKAGIRHLPGVRDYYMLFLGWLTDPDTYVVRYESLLQQDMRKEVFADIIKYLGLRADKETIDSAFRVGMNPARAVTYRVGRAGRWRERFTDDLKELYREKTGDLNARCGYF